MLHNFAFIGLGLLAQRPNDAAAGAAIIGGMMCYFGVILAIAIVVIAGQWKVFEKAGRPGWAAIIPIYNTWVLLEICDKPGWLVLLCLIPFVGWIVGLYVWVVTAFGIAEKFRVGGGFGVGLLLLPMIFYPILGFGSAQFEGRGLRRRKRRRPIEDDYEDEEDYDRPARRQRPAKRVHVEEDYEEEEQEPIDDEPPAREVDRPAARPAASTATTVSCPGCGVSLKLPATLASGKKVKCPKCSTTFTVP